MPLRECVALLLRRSLPLAALSLFAPLRVLAGDDPAPELPATRRLLDALPDADLRALPFLLLVALLAFGALLLARFFGRRGDRGRRYLSAAGGLLFLLALLPAVIVSGPGMAFTAQEGDTVVADPLSLPLDLLTRGDLVVVTPPDEGEPVVRRLIGLPGDTIELRRMQVLLNGVPLEETYAQNRSALAKRKVAAVTLDSDHYYVLADDRAIDNDSRSFGPLPSAAIAGRAVALLRTDPSAGSVANAPRLALLGTLLLLVAAVLLLRHRLHLHLRPFLLGGSLLALLLSVHPYYLVGRSMDREVADGDTAITESVSPRLGLLARGDIVAVNSAGRIEDPEIAGIDVLIKRVIGLPGETLRFKSDRIYINGIPLDEPYLDSIYQPACNCHRYEPFEITLDPDHYFVLGDNRSQSIDSRAFGPVPLAAIEARVIALLRAGPFE